jgi:mRNA interferase HigB
MRIISRSTLRQFWQQARYADSEQPLRAWFRETTRANWKSPAQVKAAYRSASILEDSRVVFNIAGNKYRLIVKINYPYGVVYIRFVGTHAEYDKIDATKV